MVPENNKDQENREEQDLINKDGGAQIAKPTARLSKSQSKPKAYIGFLFAISSAFTTSISSVLTRKCVLFTASEIALVMNVIMLVIMMSIIIRKGENLLGLKSSRCLIATRSLINTIGLITAMSSLKLISPSDTGAIVHTNVILVAIMSRLVFKEMISFVHIICLFIAVIGRFKTFSSF